ncbi:MAG TPA: sugar phosphate isomerase/epimerase family protein [Lacipirellulaceae bacterium]|jgi:sugar phosphate isomerase/epimerase|nr:sugar phosphate isomerase/epimerase family protein [Lacipirellulaceae bacterium]
MRLAYNTNGLAHHDLLDAIILLANIGYHGVSITLDHGALNPYADDIENQLARISDALATHGMQCVVETGARYLLNPRLKHEPTLVSADSVCRAQRVDFLRRAIDIASRLNARCVSLWSGIVHDNAPHAETYDRLIDGLGQVLAHADLKSMDLAFEPEPGMLIDTLATYNDLLAGLEAKDFPTRRLKLTLDIGHLHCLQECPICSKIRESAPRLANVHIEDMKTGVHEHLMFGQGEIDFRPVIAALAEIRYDGLLSVELSRHSHEGPSAAQHAYDFLRPLITAAAGKST